MIGPVRREARTFLRFATVGGLGFLVDGALLQAIVSVLNAPPLPARIASFSVALAVTFVLNRVWGFSSRERAIGRQALRYGAVQITGGAVNYCVFAALAAGFHLNGAGLWLAMAAGSAVGLVVNFVGARMFVFAPNEGLTPQTDPTRASP